MSKYKIQTNKYFRKKYKNLTKKNPKFKIRIRKKFHVLAINPFYSGLKSHRVISLRYGKKWSSRITGDIRIIWDFNKKKIKVIDVLDLGGHSGKSKVYK